MADGVTIEIKGLSELKAKLEDLGTQAAERCIRAALRAGAELETAAVIERAPIKDGTGGILPDGALRADIGFIIKRTEGGLIAIIQPGKLTRHVAKWVEYGHRMVSGGRSHLLANDKTKGPGSQVGTVPEHPFIRPAFEASRQAVTTVITTTLAKEIELAAHKK